MLNKSQSSGLYHHTSGHMTTVPIAPHGYQPKKQGWIIINLTPMRDLGLDLGLQLLERILEIPISMGLLTRYRIAQFLAGLIFGG